MPKQIQTTLVSLRFNNGRVSQAEVSAATGISQKTLSALETGTSKGIEFNTLAKLCAFFRCEPGDLLIAEEEPDTTPASQKNRAKAKEIMARALKDAMAAPKQSSEEIWKDFDAACLRVRQSFAESSGKRTRH